ncbi:hypothetical protein LEP1GSC021_4485 [Leptospira noguchii str. 1993005606]|nr:hypothetical protein LEP1GSC021_4485 [Leptospira noguchii str. 1993005606]
MSGNEISFHLFSFSKSEDFCEKRNFSSTHFLVRFLARWRVHKLQT